MTDSQLSVRETAARALGNLGGTEVQAPLIAALGDLEFSVRWSAIEALGRLKTPEVANALAGHLSQGADLLETARQLERFGPGAEPAVASVLGSKNADARREACRILGAIGTASSVKPLQAALADADPTVALVARSAIAEIKRRPANISTNSLVK
jgi:HEAT repeat protein